METKDGFVQSPNSLACCTVKSHVSSWRKQVPPSTESLTTTFRNSLFPVSLFLPHHHKQMQQHINLIKHVPFPTSTPTAFCSVHSGQFLFLPHSTISLGQPDPIKDSHTVYMHQITPHALCSAVSGVALIFPHFSAPCSFYSPFPKPQD